MGAGHLTPLSMEQIGPVFFSAAPARARHICSSVITCCSSFEITPPLVLHRNNTQLPPFHQFPSNLVLGAMIAACHHRSPLHPTFQKESAGPLLAGPCAINSPLLFAATRQSWIGRLQPPFHGTAATFTSTGHATNQKRTERGLHCHIPRGSVIKKKRL